MRHADIRTTMNVYGDAVTADMVEAHGKVVDLAFNGRGTAGKAVQSIEKLVSAEGIEPSTY